MADPVSRGPLADVRVLDLTDEKGAYCTKLLADLGADVIKVEPPGGDPTRRFAPFFADRPDPNGSLFFWYFNTNKRSVVLDLETAADRAVLVDLATEADILVESLPVGYLAGRGLDHAALRARNPRLIQTSIAPFGQTGPRAGWAGNDLTVWAMSGIMVVCGDADRPPLRGAGGQANLLAAQYATVATLAALSYQRRTGEGQAIDVSMQEACLPQCEAVWLFYAYEKTFAPRLGHGEHPLVVPVLAARTKDGYGQMGILSRAQWEALVAWLDSQGLAEDLTEERWRDDPMLRLRHRAYVHGQIAALFARYTNQELVEECHRRGLAFGPVLTPADLAGDPALAARGFFVEVETPGSGSGARGSGSRTVRFPGAPYRFSETSPAVQVPPPSLPRAGERVAWRAWLDVAAPTPLLSGEQTTDPSPPDPDTSREQAEPSSSPPQIGGSGGPSPIPNRPSPLPSPGPLQGVRVLDLSWVVAGPVATMLLADLGADVIKVEAPGVGDPLRGVPPFHPEGSPPNHAAWWNSLNCGKRSVTLDYKHPRARQIIYRLARVADVVIENFSPGTLERLVGDPEEWRRENPRLIVARMSGFGQTGARRHFMSYAPILQAMSGIHYLTAYDASEPVGIGPALSDWIGGLTAANAILAALHARTVTGRGQMIDVAQLEATLATLGPALLEYTANGRVQEPAGSRLIECPDAPQGVYPCRIPAAPPGGPAETEAWLAVAVTSDAEWEGLRRALGDPEWLCDPTFSTAAGRAAAADRIDAQLSAWTSDQDPQGAMAHLQAHGVPAGVVQNGRDLFERDDHLAARGYFVRVDHPEAGSFVVPGPGFRLDRTPAATLTPPLLGQHTEEVLREILGLTDDEISALIIEEAV